MGDEEHGRMRVIAMTAMTPLVAQRLMLVPTSSFQLSRRLVPFRKMMGMVDEAVHVHNALKKDWDKPSQCTAKDRW